MATPDTQVPPATAQSANGTAPLPAVEAPCEDCATGSERLMGILGIAAAVGLAFIGADLLTGGALSRMLFPSRDADDASG